MKKKLVRAAFMAVAASLMVATIVLACSISPVTAAVSQTCTEGGRNVEIQGTFKDVGAGYRGTVSVGPNIVWGITEFTGSAHNVSFDINHVYAPGDYSGVVVLEKHVVTPEVGHCSVHADINGNRDVSQFYYHQDNGNDKCHLTNWNGLTHGQQDTFTGWLTHSQLHDHSASWWYNHDLLSTVDHAWVIDSPAVDKWDVYAQTPFSFHVAACIETPPPPPVPGCTDEAATNYNPSATVDDGSCTYYETCDETSDQGWAYSGPAVDVGGPMWGPWVDNGDGTSTRIGVQVTSRPQYHYIVDAYDQTICSAEFRDEPGTREVRETTEPVYGCMDPAATNYNPDATVDDGSCQYPPPVDVCPNIEGNQETIPQGYEDPNQDGICTEVPPPSEPEWTFEYGANCYHWWTTVYYGGVEFGNAFNPWGDHTEASFLFDGPGYPTPPIIHKADYCAVAFHGYSVPHVLLYTSTELKNGYGILVSTEAFASKENIMRVFKLTAIPADLKELCEGPVTQMSPSDTQGTWACDPNLIGILPYGRDGGRLPLIREDGNSLQKIYEKILSWIK
jgi:hypothetical protein